jgi:hypothetical protein
MQMNASYCTGIAFFLLVWDHLLTVTVVAFSNNGGESSYHLISLPATDDYSSLASSPSLTVPLQPQSIRDLWRWKDDVLGNGHDFFTPRPRAIQSLVSLIVGQTFITTTNSTTITYPQEQQQEQRTQCWTIEECAILSNCARLDIYLLCRTNSTPTTALSDTFPSISSSLPIIYTSPKSIVAYILASQLIDKYQRTKKKSFYQSYLKDSISAILDHPDVIIAPMRQMDIDDDSSSITTTGTTTHMRKVQKELNDTLFETLGVEAILRHACLVACGMASRPNRPNRPVVFQPFSSRDAHILLQLKRTIDVTHGSHVKRLLQTSLSVGKAARDVRIVPQIVPLRKMTSNIVDRPLMDVATLAVRSIVLEPAIQRFLCDLRSRENSSRLSNIRQRLEQLVLDAGGNRQDLQALNRILHLPTIALREGKDIDEEALLESVITMLKDRKH